MTAIYKITNLVNNEFYIGASTQIKIRWGRHKSDYKHGKYKVHRAMKKYGFENFRFEILEECLDNELFDLEMKYIKELKPQYNETKGGLGTLGYVISDETKAKISKANLGKRWAKPKVPHNYITNKITLSDGSETRIKNVLINKINNIEVKDKKYTNQNIQVKCIETGVIYPSISNASRKIGISRSMFSHYFDGSIKHVRGLTYEKVGK